MMKQAQYRGTPVVPGIAHAPALWVQHPQLPELSDQIVPEPLRGAQLKRFTEAADTIAAKLEKRAAATVGAVSDLMAVGCALARDKAWRGQIIAHIEEGMPALTAVVRVTDSFVGLFTRAGGDLAERVTDLMDVHNRIVAHLQGLPEPGVPSPKTPVILIATDLSPADAAGLNPEFVKGLLTEMSGPTSHTAIVARQLGIPCVVACRDLDDIDDDDALLIDGGAGDIWVDPDPDLVAALTDRDRARIERAKAWTGPAHLGDGTPVELLANVQDQATAEAAAAAGASGIGLLRTELAFLKEHSEPPVAAQCGIYRSVFAAFPTAKVVVRTLDSGSDKPLTWAAPGAEENPALGVRGIRINRIDPEVTARQLDAIAAAGTGRDSVPWVMAPMISTVAEAEEFAALVRERGMKVGAMIEVPAVALLVDQFLPLLDFVSIGTNDLAQYVMAADRMNPSLADLNDLWQPAVLTLINQVAAAGRRHQVPVGVCGEAAADPLLACVFLGMGITSLSVAPAAIAPVGALLETVTTAQCEAAAEAVLKASSPRQARFAAADELIAGQSSVSGESSPSPEGETDSAS